MITLFTMSIEQIRKHLCSKYADTHTVISKDNYVYFAKGASVLVVAHMDTVHKRIPTANELLFNNRRTIVSAPTCGLGGDDRAGICIAQRVAEQTDVDLLFTDKEESGCIGAGEFVKHNAKKLLGQYKAIIEFDRKGKRDAVFYDCGNKDFISLCTKDYFREKYGSVSDISIIAPELNVAAVNLSCGYFNPHSNAEYVEIKKMLDIAGHGVRLINKIIEGETYYDYCENFKTNYWSYKDPYRSKYTDYSALNCGDDFDDEHLYDDFEMCEYCGVFFESQEVDIINGQAICKSCLMKLQDEIY